MANSASSRDFDLPPSPVVVSLTNPATTPALLRIGAAVAHEFETPEIIALCAVQVPLQLSLEQAAETEGGPHGWRDAVMEAVKDTASDLDVDLRTQTLWSHDASSSFLDFINEEHIAHIVMEWEPKQAGSRGKLTVADMRQVAQHTESEVSLVKLGTEYAPHDVAALVADRPQAPWAVRRAWSITRHPGASRLTLLHAREPSGASAEDDKDAGQRLIARVVHAAGVPKKNIRPVVLLDDDPGAAVIQALSAFDVACLGASARGGMAKYLFGSVIDAVSDYYNGTAIVVLGPKYEKRTVVDELISLVT